LRIRGMIGLRRKRPSRRNFKLEPGSAGVSPASSCRMEFKL
jgi:hypothetical protein